MRRAAVLSAIDTGQPTLTGPITLKQDERLRPGVLYLLALYQGAAHKVHQGALAIFIKGVLANWIVCLAVRLALSMKEEIAKITIMILVVFIFLYLSFEHSIANMGLFAMSLLGEGQITVREAIFNLVFSTAGNIVGGAVFVAIPFHYINPRELQPGQ